MSSESYHESFEKLTAVTVDLHRAIQSLKEELDAVDWYQQRIDATGDADLKAILAHNRDEEKEHASMVLEWIRRHDAAFAEALRTYLFTEGDVTAIEAEVEKGEGSPKGGESPSALLRQAAAEVAVAAAPEPAPRYTVGQLRGG